MQWVVIYYRRNPGESKRQEPFVNEEAALSRAWEIIDQGLVTPVHITDQVGNVLFSQPAIIRRRWMYGR